MHASRSREGAKLNHDPKHERVLGRESKLEESFETGKDSSSYHPKPRSQTRRSFLQNKVANDRRELETHSKYMFASAQAAPAHLEAPHSTAAASGQAI